MKINIEALDISKHQISHIVYAGNKYIAFIDKGKYEIDASEECMKMFIVRNRLINIKEGCWVNPDLIISIQHRYITIEGDVILKISRRKWHQFKNKSAKGDATINAAH